MNYSGGFSAKWTIEDQINGDPALNYDANLGPVEAPWLAWGSYLWADGLGADNVVGGIPGRSDGLEWVCTDYSGDAVHPSKIEGREKIVTRLMNHFKTHPTSQSWFLANPSGNLPPAADAGPDQSVVFPDPAFLDATITDDGLPDGTTTISWAQVSGPGTTTFSNPNGEDTNASMDTVGTYVLEVTASDGALTTSDQVSVEVLEQPPTPQPDITVPLSLDFGGVVIITTSDLTVTIANDGAADLTVTALSTTDPVFSVVGATLPMTIPPASSQDVTVRYAPTVVGPSAESLDVTSDDPDEGLVSVALSGSGLAEPEPDITVPPTLDFGGVVINTTSDLTVTITNDGTVDLTVTALSTTNPIFSVVGATLPMTVAPATSQDVTVRFAPTLETPSAGSLDVTSDDPDQPNVAVSLSGAGIPPSAVNLHINAGGASYTTLGGVLFVADKGYVPGDFGHRPGIDGGGGGSAHTMSSAIANTNDDPIYQAVRDGHTFTYSFDGLDVGSYTVTLHFVEPNLSSAGLRTFYVAAEGLQRISDYDVFAAAGGKLTAVTETFTVEVADGTLDLDFVRTIRSVLVSGISVVGGSPLTPEPDITLPPSLDFGGVVIITTSDLTVTIANDGTADLTVTALSTTDPVFSVVGATLPMTIAPASSQDVTVRYAPTVVGPSAESLDVTSDDPDEGLTSVPLSGSGLGEPEPDITAPLSLDFGGVVVNTTSDLTVTITNDGTVDLTVTALSTTDPVFSVVGTTLPMTIAPATSQDVAVRYAPTLVGPSAGSLDVTNDDPDEGLVSVALSGSGLAEPEPDITVPPTLDFGGVIINTTSDLTVTITNDGAADLTVTALSTTNPIFSVVGATLPMTVAPATSQDVTVRFAPTLETPSAGSLDVTSDDPDEGLVSVALSGSGAPRPTVALRINAGGGDYVDASGNSFVADQPVLTSDFGYEDGSTGATSSPIGGTDDNALYQTVRYGSHHYRFNGLAPGQYEVTLYFTEPSRTSAGERMFDVLAENVVVLDDYDIVAAAGGGQIAVTETFTVEVTDGGLDLFFVRVTGQAMISAISVTA